MFSGVKITAAKHFSLFKRASGRIVHALYTLPGYAHRGMVELVNLVADLPISIAEIGTEGVIV
jgi:hypothetical protein